MVNVKEMTIHKAIERDSVPSADTALKIARALHVSLEYLLDMPKDDSPVCPYENDSFQNAAKLYRKYSGIINQLEILPQKELKAVSALVDTLAN